MDEELPLPIVSKPCCDPGMTTWNPREPTNVSGPTDALEKLVLETHV